MTESQQDNTTIASYKKRLLTHLFDMVDELFADSEADVKKPSTQALQQQVEKRLQKSKGELNGATLLTHELAMLDLEQREVHWNTQHERDKNIQAWVRRCRSKMSST